LPDDRRRADFEVVVALTRGDIAAWNEFVRVYSSTIYGAVTHTLRKSGRGIDDSNDVAQDVCVRLCQDGYRLLKQYDPKRAGLKTWLGVVATTTTIDFLRRQKAAAVPLHEIEEDVGSVDPEMRDPVKIPPGLLTDRQALVLRLLYDRDMDAAEVAQILAIDAQTVRSTHHKALVKLRKYFVGGNEGSDPR